MDGITIPCIDANPDITGIGVRISVYIQTILLTISATAFLSDGSISPFENKALASASTTLLITGCALLVCSFVQAQTVRFSVYHALVVLNLSRITNMGGYLYFLAHFASSSDRYMMVIPGFNFLIVAIAIFMQIASAILHLFVGASSAA